MPKEVVHSIVLGSGEGTPIVMLHGWGQDSASLSVLGGLLEDVAEVHLLDLPGFGASPAGDGDKVWGVEEYWEAVRGYIQERAWDKVVLIGHSLGGRISIKAASVEPELVERIVLIATAGLKRKRTIREKVRFWYIGALRWGIRRIDKLVNTDIFKQWFVPRFASADYLSAGPMRASLVKCINEDLTEAASQIEVPALLLWGSDDNETPLEMAERLLELIQDSKLKVIAGEGHYPFIGAGSHSCAYEIRKFLASTS